MPTDPYVATPLDEQPRQEQNLPPGIHLPPARAWRADRPGDVAPGWPEGMLLGSPGPNVGHAVKLVHQAADSLVPADHEPRHDVEAVVADLAMRRAALAGRAPIPLDVEVAAKILGYDGSADAEFTRWRAVAVRDTAHDYPTRRSIVDAVPDDLLLLDATSVTERLGQARTAIRNAV